MSDKYEQAAIEALNTIQASMLRLGDTIETVYGNIDPPLLQFKKAKEYLAAYLREQFPEPQKIGGVRELVDAIDDAITYEESERLIIDFILKLRGIF